VAANSDEQVFARFRRNREFRQILEHVSKRQGKKYLSLIDNKYKSQTIIQFLKRQSQIGRPFTCRYPKIGQVSPTSLRYLKVFSDLEGLFGSLDELAIGEIGVGFGGQASLIATLAKVSKYHVFDLPEVLSLNQRFFHSLNLNDRFNFHDGRDPIQQSLDLVISNYAFSELTRPVQKMYLENVILNSKRGYVTWNDIAYKNFQSFSLKELFDMIPNSRIIEENPLTWPGNVIIVWGS
jgi:hypothetical protein